MPRAKNRSGRGGMGQVLFDISILVGSAAFGFFVWWDIAHRLPSSERGRRFLFSLATTLSCNILLVWSLFGVDLLFPIIHPPLQATPIEYEVIVATYSGSIAGALLSLITMILAIFSEGGLARKLCVWGSFAALIFWVSVNLVKTDTFAVYSMHHP